MEHTAIALLLLITANEISELLVSKQIHIPDVLTAFLWLRTLWLWGILVLTWYSIAVLGPALLLVWSNCILMAWHMSFPVFLPAGIPIPSNSVLGEPLFCGAAGCHGQTPPYHPGQQTAHQAPPWPASKGSAFSWGITNTAGSFFSALWFSNEVICSTDLHCRS